MWFQRVHNKTISIEVDALAKKTKTRSREVNRGSNEYSANFLMEICHDYFLHMDRSSYLILTTH